MKRRRIRRRVPRRPFGRLCGILTACLTTLIGIVQGFDPFTIFFRASVSGLVIGVAVSVGITVVRMANIPNEVKARV
jgi:hypothetical protein